MTERLQHALTHAKRRERERKYFVYVIGCCGFVKIGIAEDVNQRLANMQCGCPFDLVLLRSFPTVDPIHDETLLHEALYQWRQRGEWFKLPDAMLAKLMAMKTLRVGHSTFRSA